MSFSDGEALAEITGYKRKFTGIDVELFNESMGFTPPEKKYYKVSETDCPKHCDTCPGIRTCHLTRWA